ncbi:MULTISPECIES: LysR family transcriptional regulator [Shewanella]|uniref:LysR family transcriptional regulator n=2 Tax=Shewanella TaxID=22 RepID=A0A975AKS1_9GAMM|nr:MULTISPECIES: LysR family transcriptional regulator [Shewanella]QSX30031.1 LysR family transcriptional regulator [Shewanella cyperi]QSX37207.1 LysR family transcriptional regulator [Shewanella sedimentimangrovi]QSX40807.1 LysR family transcriptional regulator [Shewanella cyperi]
MDAAQLYRMLVFATVVEQGSLTSAAEVLGISRSMVSQHLKKLEQRTSCQLLHRTTRRISLTEDGQGFYHYCAELLLLAKQAEAVTRPSDEQLYGSLRVTAPVGLGERNLLPLIGEFHQRFPHLRLTLLLEDNKLNLLEQQIDVAIQAGWPADSEFKAIKLGSFDELLVASPEYIARHGKPLHPDNLHSHRWLMHASSHLPRSCVLHNSQGEEYRIRVTPFISCNSTNALLALACQGLGVAVLPDNLLTEQLARGELVRLLPDYHLREGGIFALHPYRDTTPPRVRVLLDFLRERLFPGRAEANPG